MSIREDLRISLCRLLPRTQCIKCLRLQDVTKRLIKVHPRQTIFHEWFLYSSSTLASKNHMINQVYLIFIAPFTPNIHSITNRHRNWQAGIWPSLLSRRSSKPAWIPPFTTLLLPSNFFSRSFPLLYDPSKSTYALSSKPLERHEMSASSSLHIQYRGTLL